VAQQTTHVSNILLSIAAARLSGYRLGEVKPLVNAGNIILYGKISVRSSPAVVLNTYPSSDGMCLQYLQWLTWMCTYTTIHAHLSRLSICATAIDMHHDHLQVVVRYVIGREVGDDRGKGREVHQFRRK
jgi:hypothetical protein